MFKKLVCVSPATSHCCYLDCPFHGSFEHLPGNDRDYTSDSPKSNIDHGNDMDTRSMVTLEAARLVAKRTLAEGFALSAWDTGIRIAKVDRTVVCDRTRVLQQTLW